MKPCVVSVRCALKFVARLLPSIFSICFLLSAERLQAEGSKDLALTNPDGYRLFMDTRDSQQMKVYARLGEFINVGASHVGIKGGYIKVYRPDGTLVATFDDSGASAGLAIINNDIEEMNGPTGGGTTNGPGYVPGIVPVDQEGVWTIRFDYPGEVELEPFGNIKNGAPWNRVMHQPFTRRVILAWDVTVTVGAPGNEGGAPVTGRVFSNEYISLLYENGVTTSPSFYVLTKAGYLYKVDFVNTDPYRFPLASNSVGVVEGGTLTPTYSSHSEADFIRSADVSTWVPGLLYLYEPQAKDYGDQIVNNKIFFNPPDPTMPATALVTDIYRNETYTTWLFTQPIVPEIANFGFTALDTALLVCGPHTMLVGQGGFFSFESNVQALGFLHLDLNNDGDFDDPVDRMIEGFVGVGLDSIFWDGLDGQGDTIPVNPAFSFGARLDLQIGEVHITVTDIENNLGGIFITLQDGDPSPEDSIFYYDHSPVGGPVSGGGAPGDPQPTTTPYVYSGGVGDNQFHDQWTFQSFQGELHQLVIQIVEECIVCDATNTPQLQVDSQVQICAGDSLLLQVRNTNGGAAAPITYLLLDSAGLIVDSLQTADPLATIHLSGGILSTAGTRSYVVVAISGESCRDTMSVVVAVLPLPQMEAIAMQTQVCSGQTAVLSAINTQPGIDSLFYTWIGPMDTLTGGAAGDDTIWLQLPQVQLSQQGLYVLVVESAAGCVADTLQGLLTVPLTPLIVDITPDTALCSGSPLLLSALNAQPDTGFVQYTWLGPDGSLFQGEAPAAGPFELTLDSVMQSQAGSWQLVLATAAGCTSPADSVVLEVAARPQIASVSGAGTYCMLDTLVLSAVNSTAGLDSVFYHWTGPGGFSISGMGDGTGPYEVVLPLDSTALSGTYSVVLEAPSGCVSDTVSVDVVVLPTPLATQLEGGGVYCIGTAGVLQAVNEVGGLSAVTYTWTGPGGFFVQHTTAPFGPFLADLGTVDGQDVGVYTLVLEGDNGCTSGPYTLEVDTLSNLVITNMMGGGHYCAGSDVVLSANTATTGGIAIISYTWTGPNGLLITDTVGPQSSFELVLDSVQFADAGTYCLTLTADNGCTTPEPACVDLSVASQPLVDVLTQGLSTCADSVLLEAALSGLAPSDLWTANWSGPNAFQQQVQGSGNTTLSIWVAPPPQGPGTGVYALQVVSADSCVSNIDTVHLNWHPSVMLNEIEGETAYCAGDTIRLSANGMVTQQLSPPTQFALEIGSQWAEAGEQLCLDVKAYNFTDILGMQWSIEWDSSQLQFDSIGAIHLPFMGPGNFNVLEDRIGVVWLDLNVAGVTLPDGTSLFQLCFTAMGSSAVQFATTPTLIELVDLDGLIDDYALIGGYVYEGSAPMATCTWIAPDGTLYAEQCPLAGPYTLELPAQIDASGTWCFTIDGDSLCGPSDTVCTEVVVYSLPVIAEIDSVIATCDDTLLLSAMSLQVPDGELVTYTWTGPGGFVFTGTAAAPGPYTALVTGQPAVEPGAYCLVLERAQGCKSEMQCVQVVECAPPTVDPAGDTLVVVCEGDDATFCAQLNADGFLDSITYRWVGANGVVLLSGTAMPGDVVCLTLPQVSMGLAGMVLLEVTGWPGGGLSVQHFELVVEPVPVPAALEAMAPCPGDTLWLSASNAVPGTGLVSYTWTGPGGGLVATGTAGWTGPFTAFVPGAGQAHAGTYCLQLESQAGCVSDTACIAVEVLHTPALSVVSGSGSYCPGDTATLVAVADLFGAEGTYQWTLPDGQVVTGDMAGSDTLVWMLAPVVAGTYTLQVTTAAGCASVPVVFTVDQYQVDTISLSANVSQLCPGEPLVLTAEGPSGGTTWYWYHLDLAGMRVLLAATTVPTLTLDPGLPGTYSVQASSGFGCLTPESAGLFVVEAAQPDAADDVLEGAFNATSTIDVLDNDLAPDGVGSLLIVEEPASGIASLDADGQLVYEPHTNFFGTDQLQYELCSALCPDLCDVAWVRITISTDMCEVPNVLTPNGDGANDKLIIPCLEDPCCNAENTLRIFNRWGDEVYSASPYRNDWEGTFGDKPLPAGTYYYLLQLDATGQRVLQGFITIVR